jgi:hypothetical protein
MGWASILAECVGVRPVWFTSRPTATKSVANENPTRSPPVAGQLRDGPFKACLYEELSGADQKNGVLGLSR